MLAALCVSVALAAAAQTPRQSTSRGVIDVLVFYATSTGSRQYPDDVRRELRVYLQRARAYRPRPRPAGLASEMRMVYNAREGYEGKLFAAAGGNVRRLAQDYVDRLKPCYEWEGFHDCPEREAAFAEQYLAENPQTPFVAFLPLLAAHRWLCTAEGYEHEKKPDQAARSRRNYESALSAAAKSPSPLFRTAAQELKASGRCHAADPFRAPQAPFQ